MRRKSFKRILARQGVSARAGAPPSPRGSGGSSARSRRPRSRRRSRTGSTRAPRPPPRSSGRGRSAPAGRTARGGGPPRSVAAAGRPRARPPSRLVDGRDEERGAEDEEDDRPRDQRGAEVLAGEPPVHARSVLAHRGAAAAPDG